MSDAPQPIFTLSESLPWYRKTSTKWIAIAALVVLLLLMWRCGKSASVNVRSAKRRLNTFTSSSMKENSKTSTTKPQISSATLLRKISV